jgi:hypothetical protein
MFADFASSTDFSNEIRDQTVKDHSFSLRYTAKATPQQSRRFSASTREVGSTLSQRRTTRRGGPLMREQQTYPDYVIRQTRFCALREFCSA